MYFSNWFVSNFTIHYKLFYPLHNGVIRFAVKERHNDRLSTTYLPYMDHLNILMSQHAAYQTSDNHGVPFRLPRCFNYFKRFKGFINALLLFTVFNCALSFHSHFTEDIWALTWIHFYHDLLICVDIHFCSTDGTCSVWLQKIKHIGIIFLFNCLAMPFDNTEYEFTQWLTFKMHMY